MRLRPSGLVMVVAFITALTTTGGMAQGPGPGSAQVATVPAVRATVTLGGGRAVTGAQGIALDPTTGLVYIGLNGTIVGGCPGDPAFSGGGPSRAGPGAHQMSIVDPVESREIAAVASGNAPIWPTVDPDKHLVYMSNSGSGTVSVHDAASGARLSAITVGGRPHMGGLDFSTGLMVVGNTVRSSNAIAEQNHATVVDTRTGGLVREFVTAPAPHGMTVDQDRDLVYFSSVGDGAITVVNAATGQDLFSAIPSRAYGTSFGNSNMITRQAATRRLFQSNSQPGAAGAIVVDEVTLKAEGLIQFGNPPGRPWGMWVDEPNRLLLVALPNGNAIGVADLDTLTHVATIPVGDCPYAVTVDPTRLVGVTSNQGSPTTNATASVFDLCPVYEAAGRIVAGCSLTIERARTLLRARPPRGRSSTALAEIGQHLAH